MKNRHKKQQIKHVPTDKELLANAVEYLKSHTEPMSFEQVRNLYYQNTISKNIDAKAGQDSKKETLNYQEIFETLYYVMKLNRYSSTAKIDLKLLSDEKFIADFSEYKDVCEYGV